MSELLFDRPFDAKDKTNRCHPELLPVVNAMRKNSRIIEKVRSIQRSFLMQDDCLCHGDFATDNILVTSDSFRVGERT